MLQLNYHDHNILIDAFAALDRKLPFIISCVGWRASILKKSLPMYMNSFYPNDMSGEKKSRTKILKFAPFAFFTPTLWGILNKASIYHIKIQCKYEENLVQILFGENK